MASKNPAWLDALLAQAYPGNANDLSQFPSYNPGDPRPDAQMSQNLGMTRAPTAGGYPIPGKFGYGSDPRAVDAAMNMNTGMAPGSFGGPMIPYSPARVRNPAAPPVPDPRNVGGAPSPGIPAPQGVNRTANNPNFSTFQYQVPNSQGGRAPIYTAANFGGPQATAPTPRGPLAAPQGGTPTPGGPGGPFTSMADVFNNLPAGFFDGSRETSGVAPAGYGPRQPMPQEAVNYYMKTAPGNVNASPDQLSAYMRTQPWLQNLGG
jgi:hypothetical protein